MSNDRIYGLIGYPISHSFSTGYFASKFKQEGIAHCKYLAFPIASIQGFKNLPKENLVGLNVTIPYKELVIPFLDELTGDAEAIQAVNTIHFKEGRLVGYNTDVYGFEMSLRPFLEEQTHTDALILGSGGASKAVKFVLDKLGIRYQVVSRKGPLSYKTLTRELVESHTLIINTTPLGMSPKLKEKPRIPYDALGEKHLLYDCIYNPEKTLFLKTGEQNGARIKNGLEMLQLQAEKSWEIWETK